MAPVEGKGNLYILVELKGEGQNRAILNRDLLNSIQDAYYNDKGDTAAALTAALQAAHSVIQQHNFYHNTRFTGGASCVAVTGGEIISAQAGPGILATRTETGLQWFSPLNNEKYVSLGAPATPAVEIGRVSVQPKTVLVVMNSVWANYLEVSLMEEATAMPYAQAVADQLAGIGIGAREELTLLVISLSAVASQMAAPAPAAAPPPPLISEENDVWENIAPAGETKTTSQGERSAAGAPTGGGLLAAARRALLRPAPKPVQPAPQRSAPSTKTTAPSRRIPYALAIVGILLLAILLITAGMWYMQGRQRADLFNQYLRGADINYQAAVAATDENQKRLYLQAAEEQLSQATLFFPEHADVARMRNQIAEIKAQVNHIQPLLTGFDLPLISFDGATREPKRVFVSGLNIYILDTQQGLLERYRLDEATGDRLAADVAPEVLVRTGDTVGGRRVGQLTQAVWAPAAGNRTATGPLVLDASNQLFSNSEGLGTVNVGLAPNSNLGLVTDAEYYIGNLYLLDTSKSQLWRYRASGDSYENPPEPYFDPEAGINLGAVSDSAIDGSVWMLSPNGMVLKYFSGAQEAFALDVADPPLTGAVTLWVNDADPPDGRIFVGDAAGNRILVFDKKGKLLSQLTPAGHADALSTLRSLWIDEATGYLYSLTDTALYQTPLPSIANAATGNQ